MKPCLCGRSDPHPRTQCPNAKQLLTPEEWDALDYFVTAQCDLYNNTGDTNGLVGFSTEDNMWIIDPTTDDMMFGEVNPVHYYGQPFVDSPFVAIAKILVRYETFQRMANHDN